METMTFFMEIIFFLWRLYFGPSHTLFSSRGEADRRMEGLTRATWGNLNLRDALKIVFLNCCQQMRSSDG